MALEQGYPFADQQDFEDAERGFIAALAPGVVRNAAGAVVWDNDSYAFLTGDAPDTVNPSLWRQSTLNAKQGLFEVTDGIYQVRGLDLSNITFVEGDRGVIVIDPLISVETAAAALGLYQAHRGERPVTGVIYTHTHADHFGGVKGVIGQEEVDAGVPVIAVDSPFLRDLPWVGEVMVVVGAVWSVDSVASTRLLCRVEGCAPISASRFTVACCIVGSGGSSEGSVAKLPQALVLSRPHAHCTVPAPKTRAPLGAR